VADFPHEPRSFINREPFDAQLRLVEAAQALAGQSVALFISVERFFERRRVVRVVEAFDQRLQALESVGEVEVVEGVRGAGRSVFRHRRGEEARRADN
jgi:hypothetical protein